MIKFVALWISAGVLFLSLGLFSPDAAYRPVAPAVPATSPASDHALPTARPELPTIPDVLRLPATPAPGESPCAAQPIDPPSPSAPTTIQAACPTGTAWTCCRCGGCGCRPMHISPTNWCAC